MNQQLKNRDSSVDQNRLKKKTPPIAEDIRWIWPFELLEKIGEGGMGVVYRARYVKNGREVAVKILPGEVGENATTAARFKREMEVLKTLKHPHIVHCFGGVCDDDKQFYAMELVEGGSLDAVLRRRKKLPWELAVNYGLQACSALAYAHSHDFVHRDVKPGNFLLTDSGQIKLSDFGLAMVSSATRLTNVGKTVGSFHYMAPEQIRGKPAISGQTDLYALGCVLFELIAGRPPFEGDNAAELLHQHLKSPPPRVSAYALDCPSALEDIINRLLEKEPEQRPASADDLAAALREVSPTKLVEGRIPPKGQQPNPVRQGDEYGELTTAAKAKRSRVIQLLLAVIVGLLAWNVTLQNQNQYVGQSQQLWINAYRDKNPALRIAAAHALSEVTSASDDTISLLATGLRDEDWEVRSATAQSIAAFGPQARSVISDLIDLQNSDPSNVVRNHAAAAVIRIRTGRSPSSNWTYFFWALFALGVGAAIQYGVQFVRRIQSQM